VKPGDLTASDVAQLLLPALSAAQPEQVLGALEAPLTAVGHASFASGIPRRRLRLNGGRSGLA
jgi:hypothetical protein